MRTSMMLVAAVLSVAACSRTEPVKPAADARPVLSFEGYGSVKFGAKLSDIAQQLGAGSQPSAPAAAACSSVRFTALPGARLMVENGIVTRADADTGTANSLGLKVGDTLEQAKAKYPQLEVGPHKYVQGGHYLTAKSPDGRAAIVMEEDGKAITKVRAGLLPAAAYVEGCG
jgi:hypothetical protein